MRMHRREEGSFQSTYAKQHKGASNSHLPLSKGPPAHLLLQALAPGISLSMPTQRCSQTDQDLWMPAFMDTFLIIVLSGILMSCFINMMHLNIPKRYVTCVYHWHICVLVKNYWLVGNASFPRHFITLVPYVPPSPPSKCPGKTTLNIMLCSDCFLCLECLSFLPT